MNEKDEQAELAALLRRAQDLADRCDRAGVPTSTTFLTPAQRCALAQWAPRHSVVQPVFSGGYPDAERQVAFFLPDWMDEPPIEETLRAVQIKPGFGTPGHRDYLGAILGLGVSRPWLGDVLVTEDGAYVLCLPSVAVTLLDQLTQVGRTGVRLASVPLASVPVPERQQKAVTFTVQSLRLDAVTAGLFHLSRTQAAERIRAGLVQLNYMPCLPAKAGYFSKAPSGCDKASHVTAQPKTPQLRPASQCTSGGSGRQPKAPLKGELAAQSAD